MTAEQAIYQFLGSFAIPAYASTSVPDQAEFPYLSYELVLGEWMEAEVNIPVNIYYRTESEAIPNAKVREMSDAIGRGGITLPCDNGMLWVKKGSPWAQSMSIEGEDDKVKRRYVNINVEFLTIE